MRRRKAALSSLEQAPQANQFREDVKDEVREARAHKAANYYVKLAQNARTANDHTTAEQLERKAALVAEAARIQYDYVSENLPAALDNLVRFYQTNKPQMLLNTVPHPFNTELFERIYAAAGVEPSDLEDNQQQGAVVDIPVEVQKALGHAEPYINAWVCDSPMHDGGALLRLFYTADELQSDGTVEHVNYLMLLAANEGLPPQWAV